METQLLTTKLFVPTPRPGLVARSRLMQRLQRWPDCPVILVSAPAGSGKTTVLTQWITCIRDAVSVSWVSLDEADNDPVRFWDYFIAAVKTFRPDVGEGASMMLHSQQPYPMESVLTALINDLASIKNDFVIVLDDYHLIQADSIHKDVAFAVEHSPVKMHVAIATRSDPNLPLGRFRGRGTILEIRADDLRFAQAEAAELVSETLGTALSDQQVAVLNDLTEGWAVGLRLAALSLRGREDVGPFLTSFSGNQRYIMDYLMEEVLRRQPQEVRDFLVKTSVLERLTGSLCDFVAGRTDSQTMLSTMERANLFVVPLDDARLWYRYHHLFRDLLLRQLENTLEAKEATLLHDRASQWYEDHAFPDEAVQHALAASDWKRAMRLIFELGEERIAHAEYVTLITWLELIPDDVLRSDFPLYLQYANALGTAGRLDAVEAALDYLEQAAGDQAALQGEVATVQAEIARRRGNPEHATESARKALSLLAPEDMAYRGRANLILGIVLFDKGLLWQAATAMTDAHVMGRQAGNYYVTAGALAYLAQILWLRGKLSQALDVGEQAAEVAGQSPAAAIPR